MKVTAFGNFENFLKLLVGGAALSLLGLVADLATISSSGWIQTIVSSKGAKYFPYILIVVMAVTLLYMYRQLVRRAAEVEDTRALSTSLMKRTVRILRAIFVDDLPTPLIRDALDPLLDELAKRLPDSGTGFKISIAAPNIDGTFEILASRGTDPASVHLLESRSNWKLQRSFFSDSLLLDEDKPYFVFTAGGVNYVNIQRPTGIGTSKQHFAVVIKNHRYNAGQYPHNSLAVVSIGIPPKFRLSDAEASALYKKIYPAILAMEAVLLVNIKLALEQ